MAIPTLKEQYENKPLHQIAALRLIRPHPGLFLQLEDVEEDERANLRFLRASYDTRGIYVMLTLLRQLLSFGYHVDTVDGEETTAAELCLLKAAKLDLGWDQAEDWRLKKEIFMSIDDGTFRRQTYSFKDLLSHPDLAHLFDANLQFRLAGTGFIEKL